MLSTRCNGVVVMKGTVLFALLMPTGYYTYLEFIDVVGSEMVKVLPLVSMMIEKKHVTLNIQGEG